MGIIDQTKASLTCPRCGETESRSAFERGSSYGSGGWGNFETFMSFSVTVERTAYGPTVTQATCVSCGEAATIKHD